MKTIILEDEKLSADHLATLIKRIDPTTQIVATFDTIKKSIEAFRNGIEADLIFADIHLADGLSFDIFSEIKFDYPVIFTTAFDEYAIKAFQVNSVDYLLKPIDQAELKKAIEKFHGWKSGYTTEVIRNMANAYLSQNKHYKQRFLVKNGEGIVSVKTTEIGHFVSEDGFVLLSMFSAKRYVVDYTLDELEEMLAPECFFRINRKVIVNIETIGKVSPYFNSRLKISVSGLNEDDCIVSRERVNTFKAWLDK